MINGTTSIKSSVILYPPFEDFEMGAVVDLVGGLKMVEIMLAPLGTQPQEEIIMIVIFTSLYSYHQYQVVKPQIHLIVVKIIIIVIIPGLRMLVVRLTGLID